MPRSCCTASVPWTTLLLSRSYVWSPSNTTPNLWRYSAWAETNSMAVPPATLGSNRLRVVGFKTWAAMRCQYHHGFKGPWLIGGVMGHCDFASP